MSAGTGEEITSSIIKMVIAKVAYNTSHTLLCPGTILLLTRLMKSISHIVIPIPTVIYKTFSLKFKAILTSEIFASALHSARH
jgi:aminoglycoside N3'-acetyltransferase